MNLKNLLSGLPIQSTRHLDYPEIHQVKTDSRLIQSGDLFIALSGSQIDAHQFIPQVIQKGAAAVITEKYLPEPFSVPIIQVSNSREAYSLIMQAWYQNPSKHLYLSAVTGSNGKTTVAYLLHTLINQTLGKSGLIGTAGYYSGNKRFVMPISGPATTPDPDQLQKLLQTFYQDHCLYTVMEASSFGISQKRLYGLEFQTILWTNFSPNHHLLYHGTEKEYFQAKASLLRQIKPDGIIILNHDMDYYEECKQLATRFESVGFHPDADLVIITVESSPDFGIKMSFRYRDRIYDIQSPLVGDFQAYNICQIFIAAQHFGVPAEEIIRTIRNVHQVPGRWEIIKVSEIPFTVLIDKANTFTSLQALFKNLESTCFHRKILVYGQVGGGDPSQRKIIGSLFSKQFNRIFLTTDDPEDEDPMIGIQQFMEGVPLEKQRQITVELSREKAIQLAFKETQPHDLVAVLGRGNQREFLVQGRTEIFDDTEQCRRIIRSFGWTI